MPLSTTVQPTVVSNLLRRAKPTLGESLSLRKEICSYFKKPLYDGEDLDSQPSPQEPLNWSRHTNVGGREGSILGESRPLVSIKPCKGIVSSSCQDLEGEGEGNFFFHEASEVSKAYDPSLFSPLFLPPAPRYQWTDIIVTFFFFFANEPLYGHQWNGTVPEDGRYLNMLGKPSGWSP